MGKVNVNEVISKAGSERALLSILLRNPKRIIDCMNEGLFPDMFSVYANQIIYSVLCYLIEQTENIDSLLIYNTVQDEKAKAAIDEIGGMQYLDALNCSMIADNLNIYMKQIKDTKKLRDLFMLGDEIKTLVLNEEEDVEKLISRIQEKSLELSLKDSEAKIKTLGQGARERLNQRINNPREIAGYAVGWRVFDKTGQGVKGNELVVVVGESKTGKSTLLLNIAKKLSYDVGIKGIYIDTEMTSEEQEDRLISLISGVPLEEIVNGMCNKDTEYGAKEDKMLAIDNALRILESENLKHIYMPDFTIEKVQAVIRKAKIEDDIKYAIFDYIKLPSSEVMNLRVSQEYQQLGYFTTCLKDLAGQLDIPILTAAQANRTNLGTTEPDAGALGGSYRILQMCTKMYFIRNKKEEELIMENYTKGNQKLHLMYQRSGGAGKAIDFQFDRPILRMREVI